MKKFNLDGKKRYIAAAIAAATLGGGAFAFANTLTVTSNTLAAGSGAVDRCNTSAHVAYTTAWDDADLAGAQYVVNGVTLTSAAGCGSMAYRIEFRNGATLLHEYSGTLNGSGTATPSVTVGATPDLQAADVTTVDVVITG